MTTLARRLGLVHAVGIGLGSMIGAGVFVVWGPASAAAGSALPLALGLAALVALANALASAQLASVYPEAGGTYLYGREVLGPWWGFLAGWGFVIGKTASAAAMALTIGSYLWPGPAAKVVSLVVVAVVTALNLGGVTRTARATWVIVTVVVIALIAFVAVTLVAPPLGPVEDHPTGYGVLQAAGLIFFAFAGYARIATLGEEVIDPARTIPRAIVIALALAVVIYGAMLWALTRVLGQTRLATSATPVAEAMATLAPGLVPVVALVAGLAASGALLALVAGIGRTMLAMARRGDLPAGLAEIDQRRSVPRRAEVVVAVVVALVIGFVDLRGAIGFSSFGVLLYYFVTNLAAWRQTDGRRYPRWLQGLGMVGCLVLVATLPWTSVAAGVAVSLVGVAYRLFRLRRAPTA